MTDAPKFTARELAKVRPLADSLIATAEANRYWEQIDELSAAECHALDSIAFECTACNQWYDVRERKEVDGQYVCQGCAED